MLDRTDLEPVFFAPFVSSLMRVEPQWIDYNGHLNMAYYNVLFDRAVDEVYELLGIGLDYLKQHNHSTFTAEVHVRYLRELRENDPGARDVPAARLRFKARPLFRAVVSRDRRLGLGHIGKHDIARRHGGKKSRAVSRKDHGRARAHESRARAIAAAGSRRTAHCDAARIERIV